MSASPYEPEASRSTRMAPQRPETILIIDDAPAFVRGLARLLRRDGYTVDTAGDGNCALAQLQERRYDVVLCDLHMPELDGPAFYDILMHQYAYLRQRVIFITGDTLNAVSMAFLEQCGQPWLSKPCTIAMVQNAIQQVLRAVQALRIPYKAS
jgi:CheY-like chemotaxis protein